MVARVLPLERTAPDLILFNGSSITMHNHRPHAEPAAIDRDSLRTDPMQVVNIPIERTMVGGRWVYES